MVEVRLSAKPGFLIRFAQQVRAALLMIAVCSGIAQSAEVPQVDVSVNWEGFLARHDLLWNRMPADYYEAPFLGNGMMGAMVRQSGERTVRWDVGRGDVQDHRPTSDRWGMFSRCRLPIGFFELTTVGVITGGTARLDLWNAEASGEIQTDRGSIRWLSFVHAEHMAMIVSVEPSEGEKECRWVWHDEPAVSPRQAYGVKTKVRSRMMEGYQPNPPAGREKVGDINISIQPLLSGGETATAWAERAGDSRRILTASVAHSFPGTNARIDAVQEVRTVLGKSPEELRQLHRAWWHGYYPASFVSIPDTYWESFYWIQMYKLASATRSDGMLIDNLGPWLYITPWPGAWWNLNVQLTYWPTYAANRLELGESLNRSLYSNRKTLIENVPEAYRHDSAGLPRATGQDCAGPVDEPNGENSPEIGLLLWACHNSWLHYRHTMDDEVLRNDLFPLLRRAVNYHLHFVSEGEDGKLHLPRTYSPEYGAGPDCNFDLALLRWGCTALIEACARLQIDDSLLPRWKEVLEKLVDYPVDENGYMIARGLPFEGGHRHYSHLLMLYPLYLVTREQDGAEELMLRSVRHWHSMPRRAGYSFTGASSISSAFGRGNDALDYLNELRPFLQRNTLYREAGPVIETPLSGAQSIHDMLIQSWGGTIRVFPAVPDAWPDIAFHDLSAEGGFLVSAKRTDGKSEFVRIKSLAGEPCRIRPGLEGEVKVAGDRAFVLEEMESGLFALDLQQGEEAILWSGERLPYLTISPVQVEEAACNRFGVR